MQVKPIFKCENSTYYPNKRSLSFRGMPWTLNPSDYGVANYGSISAKDAEKLYSKLACGNYLDIGEDKTAFVTANQIRKRNLAFLDRVTDISEQEKFIEYYKRLTGFPNLSIVSDKIEKEFVNAVDRAQKDLYYTPYTIEQAGYDGICSVGRKKAFPGSDLDKAYVIIKGTGNANADIECVNQFKGKIWKYTDQRLLSYNHDEAAFPQVYTRGQLKNLVTHAEEKAKILYGEYPRSIPDLYKAGSLFERILRSYISIYSTNKMNTYNTNYVDANRFYIGICNATPHYSNTGATKESIKNIGFVLEAMREGKIFEQFGQITDKSITNTWVYKLVNLSQLKALKAHIDKKPKRLMRVELQNEFHNWEISKQFRFIKTLINSACANNQSFTQEFAKYFSKPGEDLFAPLIKALMR